MPQDFTHKEFLPSVVEDKTEHKQKYLRRETDLKSVDMKQTAPTRIAFQGKIVSNNLFECCIEILRRVWLQGFRGPSGMHFNKNYVCFFPIK